MQTIVTFDWTRSIVSERVAPKSIIEDHRTDVAISKAYAEYVQHLFNYGMNACNDRVLAKNCIVQCFLLVGTQPEILAEDESVVTNIFKVFRRLLIQETNLLSQPAQSESTHELTSLQQEALFLKFHCRLTYREVAKIMDLQIEQLRSLISKTVGVFVREK